MVLEGIMPRGSLDNMSTRLWVHRTAMINNGSRIPCTRVRLSEHRARLVFTDGPTSGCDSDDGKARQVKVFRGLYLGVQLART